MHFPRAKEPNDLEQKPRGGQHFVAAERPALPPTPLVLLLSPDGNPPAEPCAPQTHLSWGGSSSLSSNRRSSQRWHWGTALRGTRGLCPHLGKTRGCRKPRPSNRAAPARKCAVAAGTALRHRNKPLARSRGGVRCSRSNRQPGSTSRPRPAGRGKAGGARSRGCSFGLGSWSSGQRQRRARSARRRRGKSRGSAGGGERPNPRCPQHRSALLHEKCHWRGYLSKRGRKGSFALNGGRRPSHGYKLHTLRRSSS